MKNNLARRALLTLCTGLLVSAVSQAKDTELPDHKLSDFKLGSLVTGDSSDLENLDGKVVVIEYWGTR